MAEKPYTRALFVFRRDLRLEDNTGLLAAAAAAQEVQPCFIFDPRQYRRENPYFSPNAFQFLLRSLEEVAADFRARNAKLYCFEGDPAEVVAQLIHKDGIDAVYCNRDYTPFSIARDEALADVCRRGGAQFHSTADVALSPVDRVRTGEGEPYSVFTPFYKKAATYDVSEPHKNNFHNFRTAPSEVAEIDPRTLAVQDVAALPVQGGREEALAILRDTTLLAAYPQRRNVPATHGTSRLSAHLKFGTVSPREVYAAALAEVGAHHAFVSELYWRDFWLHISFHFPHVFGASFYEWGDHIRWENSHEQFAQWCDGMTGVPMVDAGMRELNHTGWMHNRSRMIVASFLTKNLLIDWRWGERYFATKLVDYDPSSNNGNWQWGASVGADPRPLRIFNPYTQAEKYDSDAAYITHWVPQLAHVDTELLTSGKEVDFSAYADYPAPIVSARETYHRARERYRAAKDGVS